MDRDPSRFLERSSTRSAAGVGTAVDDRPEDVAQGSTSALERGLGLIDSIFEGPHWPPPRWVIAAGLGAIGLIALLLRFWAMTRFGLNSDEAVYIGQAANLAGIEQLSDHFSVFRAHPLLF